MRQNHEYPTMTVGQLRERLASFPDDALVFAGIDDCGERFLLLQVYRTHDGACRLWGNGYQDEQEDAEDIEESKKEEAISEIDWQV